MYPRQSSVFPVHLGLHLDIPLYSIKFSSRKGLHSKSLHFSKAFVLKVQLFPLATFRIRKSNDLPLSAPRPLLSSHDQNYLQIPKFLLSAMPLRIYLEKLLNSCSFVLRCHIHIALLSSASSFWVSLPLSIKISLLLVLSLKVPSMRPVSKVLLS